MTSECLKAIGKLPIESERLIILVITGGRTDAQSFRREVGIGSNSHCLLGRLQLQRQDGEFEEMTGREGGG